jgi:hypothetical protein
LAELKRFGRTLALHYGLLVAKKERMLRVEARPFSYYAQERPLDWPPPMAELLQRREAGEFVWRRLQYVFRFPDPRKLAPAKPKMSKEEQALLSRFVEQARTLAATSLMSAKDQVTVNVPDFGGPEEVLADFSAPDVTTGFMVLLRQCYAHDEEASFAKTRKIAEHRLSEVGDTETLGTLKAWRKAHARLLNQALEELVQEQLIADGKMPAELDGPDGKRSAVVRAPATPTELLRTFWYGGQIHWGSQREAIAALETDSFQSAWWNIHARHAALDMAHFYIGYAVLVERVLEAAA